jgi:hypothetical protein
MSGTAEGGGNSGSDFGIVSFTDGGAELMEPIQIMRSTGIVVLTQGADANGQRIRNVATPTAAGDAVNRQYSDTKWTMWSGTQTAYNAIGTKDPSTLYVITGP